MVLGGAIAMFSGNDSLFFSSEYYQVRIAIHLLSPEGWKAELAYRWLVTYPDGLPARRQSPI